MTNRQYNARKKADFARITGKKPSSLESLMWALKGHDAAYKEQRHWNVEMTLEELDWCSLPTFGGREPHDTSGIWSWDKTSILWGDCADDLEIITRAEWKALRADRS